MTQQFQTNKLPNFNYISSKSFLGYKDEKNLFEPTIQTRCLILTMSATEAFLIIKMTKTYFSQRTQLDIICASRI